jgi:hypothetical protein
VTSSSPETSNSSELIIRRYCWWQFGRPACRLTGKHYLLFLSDLLEDVPLAVKKRMWFIHDGLPAPSNRVVPDVLNRRTGTEATTARPSHSLHLSPMDFYLCGHFKALLYSALLIERRHFTGALWKSVTLSPIIVRYLNWFDSPWKDLPKHVLILMEDISGTSCKYMLSML